ncbi:site-2 protease family protein [Paenibacillaceae bacterium]|nr:site-2 protease family protein [Paenibacillaceae bacterium]
MAGDRTRERRSPWWIITAALLFIFTKGKYVILMLGKFGPTLISMALTVGAYALLSPIWFAVGFVALILVHELGHVLAAKQKGLPVSMPLFIPFVGALISMKRHPKDAVTEAYIALGGPVVGTIGALLVYAGGYMLDMPLLFVLAKVGFFLNLINLLPVHPLDGGRIATAVSRWLWLVGLVGGLIVIIMLKSILFSIIWVFFAWNLYQKYVRYRKHGKPYHLTGIYEVDMEPLQLPGWYFSGDQHKRELPFNTYCKLSGEHMVRFEWDTLNFRGEIELPMPGIANKVQLISTEQAVKDGVEKLRISIRIDYEQYENDRYYEVPPKVRWKFGAAYAGLALFLIGMMWSVQAMDLGGAIR